MEEPWKKRSRIALRSSALASNHRGGNGLAALKMYVKVRTAHGTGGTCWASLGSLKVALPFRSHPSPSEGSSDVVREHSWWAGRRTNTGLKLTATVGCCQAGLCDCGVLHGGIVASRTAEVGAGRSQVPGPKSLVSSASKCKTTL